MDETVRLVAEALKETKPDECCMPSYKQFHAAWLDDVEHIAFKLCSRGYLDEAQVYEFYKLCGKE